MDVDKNLKYMQFIVKGAAPNKYKQVLAGCKELEKGVSGYQWALGETKYVTMEQFCTWDNVDALDGSVSMYFGPDRCSEF